MAAFPSSASSAIPAKQLRDLRRVLLGWYDKHRRDLPWRKTRDPYRIWLSEIMLQQTRVAAVLDHYRVFLERFPNLEALAAAPEDAALAAWSGLGYYTRARRLHQCAREIVAEHRGRFPRDPEVLRTLPGIGRYTAAAIASIVFDRPIAVVDGNVERVLQRLTGRDLTQPEALQLAQSLLHMSRPGDFNQAMMELGATVCVPRGPKCLSCPIRKWCTTRGEVPRAESPRQTKKEVWCALDQRDGQVRLIQRPKESALMPGMWELPQLSQKARRTPASSAWRTFRHSITVTDLTVHVHRGVRPAAKGKWIPLASLSHLPVTGLTRKVLKAAGII